MQKQNLEKHMQKNDPTLPLNATRIELSLSATKGERNDLSYPEISKKVKFKYTPRENSAPFNPNTPYNIHYLDRGEPKYMNSSVEVTSFLGVNFLYNRKLLEKYILGKYFFFKGDCICITYANVLFVDFYSICHVNANFFNIKISAISQGYIIPPDATKRDMCKILGVVPRHGEPMKDALAKFLEIEDIVYKSSRMITSTHSIPVIAISEYGKTQPFNSKRECAISFNLSSSDTVNDMIRSGNPIIKDNVKWWFYV